MVMMPHCYHIVFELHLQLDSKSLYIDISVSLEFMNWEYQHLVHYYYYQHHNTLQKIFLAPQPPIKLPLNYIELEHNVYCNIFILKHRSLKILFCFCLPHCTIKPRANESSKTQTTQEPLYNSPYWQRFSEFTVTGSEICAVTESSSMTLILLQTDLGRCLMAVVQPEFSLTG